jgi:hypothetical protein
MAVDNCVATACPQTDGGPCVSVSSSACQTCGQNAQGGGGPCASAYTACIDDMSGSPGASTGTEGCAALASCLNSCPTTGSTAQTCVNACFAEATAAAQQLYYEAGACIGDACPSESAVDGGAPCADQSSTACTNCSNAAQMSGGACYTSVGNCENN